MKKSDFVTQTIDADDKLARLRWGVYRGLHVVVNAPAWNASQRGKGARMRIEQHFVALRGVCLYDKRTAETQLEMGQQYLAPDRPSRQQNRCLMRNIMRINVGISPKTRLNAHYITH